MAQRRCQICDNEAGNRLHQARELFHGTRDLFTYIECAVCGTLQLQQVPDLARYYPKDYYSYQPATGASQTTPPNFKERLSRRLAANYYGNRRNILGKYLTTNREWLADSFPAMIRDTTLRLGITTRSSILDVGAGRGQLLLALSECGFADLTGVDPFLDADLSYANGVRVLKAQLAELERRYDLIMMNHSLEHVPDPRRTLAELHAHLKDGKYAIIRMPVVAAAWRKYGVNWAQLDAPRHLFLFTVKTFTRLAEAAGFAVAEVIYDSTGFQFWGSELYARDIPLMDERSYFVNPKQTLFSAAELADFEQQAAELNARGEGDSAAFYLQKRAAHATANGAAHG